MAAVGYLSSEIVVLQILEEGVRVGWFQEYNALLGFFLGGRLLGRMVGEAVSIIYDERSVCRRAPDGVGTGLTGVLHNDY